MPRGRAPMATSTAQPSCPRPNPLHPSAPHAAPSRPRPQTTRPPAPRTLAGPTPQTSRRAQRRPDSRTAPGVKPVWEHVEAWLKAQGGRVKPRRVNAPKLVGMQGNPGIAG